MKFETPFNQFNNAEEIEKPEQAITEQEFATEVARWEVEYPREWPLVHAALGQIAITNTNREIVSSRISTLLAGLRHNTEGIDAQTRVATAIADLKQTIREKAEYQEAA